MIHVPDPHLDPPDPENIKVVPCPNCGSTEYDTVYKETVHGTYTCDQCTKLLAWYEFCEEEG